MIKNIVFDMGNVLLDYNPEVILDKVCALEGEKAILRKELFEEEEWKLGDLGLMNNQERYESVKKRVPEELHAKLKECVEHWDICMIPLVGAQEFCHYVKEQGYGVYVLSNASPEFYTYFPKYYPLDFFDGVVVSSDLHIVKPDLRIYQHLLDKYRLVPEECLFLDDRQDNVEGARATGMQAEVFDGDFDRIRELLKK